jgi:hypothetical protein
MKTEIKYAMAFWCVVAVLLGWRACVLRGHEAPHFEIVEDLSLSHPDGCDSLLGLAEEALRFKDVLPGSTLNVLVIGDEATGNEPWRLGSYLIPTTRKAIEGRAGDLRRQQEILQDLSARCRAARRTQSSPIFLGVKQGLADLRSQGCGPTSHCELFVDSDLEENVEAAISSALNGSGKHGPIPTVDNKGIDIVFCGEAVTSARPGHSKRENCRGLPRTANRENRLRQTWSSVFTAPERVRFEPYCPQTSR